MDSTGYFFYNSVSVEREELMGIVDQVEQKAKEWLLKVAIAKGIKSAAKLIFSYCATKGIIFVGTVFGVVIDTGSIASLEAALTLGINSLLAVVKNWAKHKWPNLTWL